jgi:hypothetical protein
MHYQQVYARWHVDGACGPAAGNCIFSVVVLGVSVAILGVGVVRGVLPMGMSLAAGAYGELASGKLQKPPRVFFDLAIERLLVIKIVHAPQDQDQKWSFAGKENAGEGERGREGQLRASEVKVIEVKTI